MDRDVFDELRSIVYAKSGISLSENKTALVSSRLNKRLRALELDSYRDYLNYLKDDSDGAELVQFLDVISTNTTSFFREEAHFELFAELLAKWEAEGLRRLRFWCAASSSGEEPYTIAMTIRETIKDPSLDIKILATDISTRILAQAQEGVYDSEKVKGIPAHMLHRHFTKIEGRDGETLWSANDSLRSLLTFRRLNLSTPPFPMHGAFDVVFCRNVMIYFDNPVRQRLIDEVVRLLKYGGYLMVGHSESLTGIRTILKTVRPAVYLKD